MAITRMRTGKMSPEGDWEENKVINLNGGTRFSGVRVNGLI